jgi:hypothetical protein
MAFRLFLHTKIYPYLPNIQSLQSYFNVYLLANPNKYVCVTVQNEKIFCHQIILSEVVYFCYLLKLPA